MTKVMSWINNIFRELFGLFVDDGSFALVILVWVGLVWLVGQRWNFAVPGGILLFGGLALILGESVVRFAKRSARSKASMHPR